MSRARAAKLIEPTYYVFAGLHLRKPTTLPHASEAEQKKAAESLFNELTPELINWASDEVLVAWSRFKRNAISGSGVETVFDFEKVLLAIRHDYGHKGKNVSEGDLLGLFINDIDDHLALRKGKSKATVVAQGVTQPE